MSINNFIFSNKAIPRICRHLVFWMVVFFLNLIGAASVYFADAASSLDTYLSVSDIASNLDMTNVSVHTIYVLRNFMILIPYCYLFAYWFVPSLLMKGKYARFTVWLITLTAVGHIASLYIWGFSWQMPRREMLAMLWFSLIAFVNNSPPITCGLFIAIKMLKTWLIKEEEKLVLVRENANAELQLLKAQVHPHFLFNTLNNIYSFALDRSAKAPELVFQLSTLLRYMIIDCEAPMVPVEKEIRMIEDYIGLERVRYGDRLDLQIQIKRSNKSKLIVPFLLLPFVENSFKHGASEVLENPWIRLTLVVNDDDLFFELMNNKPRYPASSDENKGIGLSNVKKRLQLLYPASHELCILTTEQDYFAMSMRIPLVNVRR